MKEEKCPRVVLVWDNFGPLHVDRCEAVAARLEGRADVIGLEWFSKSTTYKWERSSATSCRIVTLFRAEEAAVSVVNLVAKTYVECARYKRSVIFLCHYEKLATFVVAILLRLSGRRVYCMGCSKFDDYPRTLWRELAKVMFYIPYMGAIASGSRSRDYTRFLGFTRRRVVGEYNTVSVSRIRASAGAVPAPGGVEFASRHFSIVARLVPKKNISLALQAFSIFRRRIADERELHIYGDGELEAELVAEAAALGIANNVRFHGFVQSSEIARATSTSLALILPSKEEQFGNVVVEFLAMGVPILISETCGARDRLVRSGVNGFFFEPDNPEGLALFMALISRNPDLWQKLAQGACNIAKEGDAERFAEGVEILALS